LRNLTVASLLKLPADTKVVSFVFTTDNSKGEVVRIENTGNELSSKILGLMQTDIGRVFTIDNIVISENGQERRIPSLVYEVVD
jgi:hypothetical protein